MISTIIISLVVLFYLLGLVLDWLNYQRRNLPIPEIGRGIYDEAQYAKWLNYSMETSRYSVIVKTVSTAFLLALLSFGAFGWLEGITNAWFSHPVLQTLAFLGVFMLVSMLISLPFEYYATFVIEEKFGFNKTTQKTFWLDQLKSLLLIILLGGAIVTGINALYLAFVEQISLFILSAWVLLSVVTVILFVLNNKIFVKLFNKLSPLPEGSLKTEIESLARKVGFNVNAIWVMDASKRSTKLNAFFSGLGKTREVVLFDTLIEKMEQKEVLTVLAHELGHAIHKDVPRLLGVQIAVFGMYAAIIGAILQSAALPQAFGLSGVHFGFSIILFSILASPLEFLLGIPVNVISRKAEYAADAFAVRLAGKEPAISVFKTLAQENLANLNPHPLYVWFYYNHPTIPQRLSAIHALPNEA
jgi:STE24 endopeptidase